MAAKGEQAMTTSEPVDQTVPIPIACNPRVFTQDERAAHFALARDVLFDAPLRRDDLPDGFLFHYQGDELRFLAIARFVAGEHRCCPWASFAVEMDPFAGGAPGAIRLRFISGTESKAALAGMLEQVRANHSAMAVVQASTS
jgi:hypothetical protein